MLNMQTNYCITCKLTCYKLSSQGTNKLKTKEGTDTRSRRSSKKQSCEKKKKRNTSWRGLHDSRRSWGERRASKTGRERGRDGGVGEKSSKSSAGTNLTTDTERQEVLIWAEVVDRCESEQWKGKLVTFRHDVQLLHHDSYIIASTGVCQHLILYISSRTHLTEIYKYIFVLLLKQKYVQKNILN